LVAELPRIGNGKVQKAKLSKIWCPSGSDEPRSSVGSQPGHAAPAIPADASPASTAAS
jgi:hypothetical protein